MAWRKHCETGYLADVACRALRKTWCFANVPFRAHRRTQCWQVVGLQGACQNSTFGERGFQEKSETPRCLCALVPAARARQHATPLLIGRRTKSNARKAISHTANAERHKPPQKHMFCRCFSCRARCKMKCLANVPRRTHRKTRCLVDVACSSAAFGERGLQEAPRTTTMLQTHRKSMTASPCSYSCFAQAFQRLAQAGQPSPPG